MLVGNMMRLGGNPGHFLAAPDTAYSVARGTWSKGGTLRNFYSGEATVISGASIAAKQAIPNGYVHPYCWVLAPKPGGMATYITISGTGAVTSANLAGGKALDAALAGAGDITDAALGLIVQAVANLVGSGSVTADIVGVLQAAASLAGSGDVNGTLDALADLIASLGGTATVTATTGGTTGSLSASITVTGATLTTANVAAAVWSALATQNDLPATMGELLNGAVFDDTVEGSLSVREALRIVLAALAGKLSGAPAGPIVVRDTDDTKDRITATVDVDGNRTAVTLDPS